MKVFLDSASPNGLKEALELSKEWNEENKILGVTTNPSLITSLMKGKWEDYPLTYRSYIDMMLDAGKEVDDFTYSFQVLSDDPVKMFSQAIKMRDIFTTYLKINQNAFVKIPVMRAELKDDYFQNNYDLIRELVKRNVPVNITGVTSYLQVEALFSILPEYEPSIISVFCGRMADAGITMSLAFPEIRKVIKYKEKPISILWGSVRSPGCYYTARYLGADIITMPAPILIKKVEKEKNYSKDWNELTLSHQAIKQFVEDAKYLKWDL